MEVVVAVHIFLPPVMVTMEWSAPSGMIGSVLRQNCGGGASPWRQVEGVGGHYTSGWIWPVDQGVHVFGRTSYYPAGTLWSRAPVVHLDVVHPDVDPGDYFDMTPGVLHIHVEVSEGRRTTPGGRFLPHRHPS